MHSVIAKFQLFSKMQTPEVTKKRRLDFPRTPVDAIPSSEHVRRAIFTPSDDHQLTPRKRGSKPGKWDPTEQAALVHFIGLNHIPSITAPFPVPALCNPLWKEAVHFIKEVSQSHQERSRKF